MITICIALFIGLVIGFFIGVLFVKRNPGYMERIDDAYIKGRTEAEQEIKDKLKQAEEYIKNRTGSVEVSPVPVGELKKYLLRFGLPLLALVGLIAILKPENVILVFYKICLILIGLLLCEAIWLISYKPVFGKIEEIKEYERRSVLIFRGVLYLAVILGITWGL